MATVYWRIGPFSRRRGGADGGGDERSVMMSDEWIINSAHANIELLKLIIQVIEKMFLVETIKINMKL